MISTSSSRETEQEGASASQAEQNEAALREGLELREGIRRLLMLFSVESIGGNMEEEDRAVWRNTKALEKGLWGHSQPGESSSAGGEDMRITAARDVIYNKAPEKRPSGLAKIAIAASIASGLGGAGLAAFFLSGDKPSPTVIQQGQEDDFSLGIGPLIETK